MKLRHSRAGRVAVLLTIGVGGLASGAPTAQTQTAPAPTQTAPASTQTAPAAQTRTAPAQTQAHRSGPDADYKALRARMSPEAAADREAEIYKARMRARDVLRRIEYVKKMQRALSNPRLAEYGGIGGSPAENSERMVELEEQMAQMRELLAEAMEALYAAEAEPTASEEPVEP